MRTKLKPEDHMTVEDFRAFTATRPDEERWELFDGTVATGTPTQSSTPRA